MQEKHLSRSLIEDPLGLQGYVKPSSRLVSATASHTAVTKSVQTLSFFRVVSVTYHVSKHLKYFDGWEARGL